MSMAENTAMDKHYAPSEYSQFTDTTTRPFKPLYVPTEADEERYLIHPSTLYLNTRSFCLNHATKNALRSF